MENFTAKNSKSNKVFFHFAILSVLSCFSSKPVFAEDLSAVRDLISNAPENSWIQMNTNKFSDAWVPEGLRAYDNTKSVIGAWSSFAWDSNRGDLLIFGGGHANYAGNEVYRWRSSTLQWEVAALPSQIDYNNHWLPIGGAEYAPQSSHTYDNSVFLPLADRYVTFGGSAFNSSGSFVIENPDGSIRRTGPYFFDPAKADPTKLGGADGTGVNPSTPGGYMWENRDIYGKPGFAVPAPGSSEGTTDYALENGKEVIYISGPQGGGTEHMLAKLTINDYKDPSQDQWQVVGVDWRGSSSQGAGAYDPIRNLYIKTYFGSTQFSFWDLDNAGPTNHNIHASITSAPANFVMNSQYGMDYDPIRDRFLLWGNGGEVFQLNVGNKDGTNWTITELSVADGSTPAPYTVESKWDNNAVLGKWHYSTDLDVFVGLQGAVDGNVWFFKPTGWTGGNAAVPIPGGLVLMFSGLGLLFAATKKTQARINLDGIA